MSNLTQFFQIGRGLLQLPDATIEVLPDGTTLTFNTSNQLYIPNGAINTAQIADNSITDAKIATQTTTKITVPTSMLSGTITNSQIADGAITKAKMTDTGKAQIYFRYYEGISATTVSYDAPFLLNGWKLLRVNVVTRGWIGDENNYWRVYICRVNTSGTNTLIGSINCIPITTNPTWMLPCLGPYTADADYILYAEMGKVGTAPNFNGYIQYVIAPTDTVYRV
jgi:hypothetical protein